MTVPSILGPTHQDGYRGGIEPTTLYRSGGYHTNRTGWAITILVIGIFMPFRFLFQQYNGLRYQKGNCGVSIVRSGEAMEKALQDCCRSMRIGKILVDSATETLEARYKSTIS